jgi:hypothetical protein
MSGTSSDGVKSSGPPVEANAPAEGARSDSSGIAFGDVSNPQQLRESVRQLLERRAVTSPRPTDQPQKPTSTEAAPPTGQKSSGAFDEAGRQPERAACAAAARRARGGTGPVLSGTGIESGRPVYVFVFPRGNGYEVLVTGRPGCTVISRTAVG